MSQKKPEKVKKMPKRKLLAFQLKYEGNKNPEIAQQTRYSIKTIETYLAPKGKWYPEYEEFEQENNEIMKQEALKMAKRNIRNAMATIINLMSPSEDPAVRLKAAKEIINRELGEALKKVEHSGEIQTALVEFIGQVDEKEDKDKISK